MGATVSPAARPAPTAAGALISKARRERSTSTTYLHGKGLSDPTGRRPAHPTPAAAPRPREFVARRRPLCQTQADLFAPQEARHAAVRSRKEIGGAGPDAAAAAGR